MKIIYVILLLVFVIIILGLTGDIFNASDTMVPLIYFAAGLSIVLFMNGVFYYLLLKKQINSNEKPAIKILVVITIICAIFFVIRAILHEYSLLPQSMKEISFSVFVFRLFLMNQLVLIIVSLFALIKNR